MTTALAPAPHRIPRRVIVSAWAVPVFVLGDFALLAMFSVALVLLASVQDARVRALRWPARLLAAVYATPLAIWLLRPDGAQSLSKDIHPVFVVLVVAASAVVLLRIRADRR